MYEAVINGEVRLLENFCETFGSILELRPDIMQNPHLLGTGETILHTVLLMDFDKNKISY